MMDGWAIRRLAAFLLLLMLHAPPGSEGSAFFSEISAPESSSAPLTINGERTLLDSAPSPLIAMNNYHSRADTPNSHRDYAAAPAPSLPWNSSSLSPPPTPGLSVAPISVAPPSSHHMRQKVPVSLPPEEALKLDPPPTYPPSEDESSSSLVAPSPQTDKDNDHSSSLTPESQGNYLKAPSLHQKSSSTSPQTTPGLNIVPASALSPSDRHMRQIVPVSAPPDKTLKSTSPPTYPPFEGKPLSKPRQPKPIHHPAPEPIISPVKSHFNVSAPSAPFFRSSPKEIDHDLSPAPSPSTIKKHHLMKSGGTVTPTASPSLPPAIYGNILPPGSSSPPLPMGKKNKEKAHRSWLDPPDPLLSPTPVSTSVENNTPAPSPSGMVPFATRPALHPLSSPISSPRKPKAAVPPVVFTLPPPPPNEDCLSLTCYEPLTNTLPGSPCDCIWPMQVKLRLSVFPFTFFPLVSELAQEIAAGVFIKQSQVRIMSANPASEQSDKTVVLIDLVPIGKSFDGTTALLIYKKFWYKQVIIKPNLFGSSYDVLYVRYPGLPPSPPMAPSDLIIDEGPFATGGRGRAIKPIGVDVKKQHRRKRLSRSAIAIIVLSSAIIFVLCVGAIWLCLFMVRRRNIHHPLPTPNILLSPVKSLGQAGSLVLGGGPSSGSLPFSSNIATYTVSAKTFSLGEIERATDNFDNMKILGEGGFGRVYKGMLYNGTEVAVKILKRDDRQGSREFLAEVEMLSRLHHRNLVKLIGICIEERNRCLVYELIPNGSVESHLHGVDKESAPLDWNSRMKIALGSARGLAYLHEDSSPRVIHRDFKASNILLEHDFTPKVADFGLARTALEEENGHISTRVMGTFGYVAPEYAMTGHLLVKSDVYSYGVVLLELLTGRKPVDMSRPPGQENLVSWANPLLTSEEGLEAIIDPSLGSNIPFDNVVKVAAIASMCVQSEVSNRPFMGEVVQALKLVCVENEDTQDESTCSREDSSSKMCTSSVTVNFKL